MSPRIRLIPLVIVACLVLTGCGLREPLVPYWLAGIPAEPDPAPQLSWSARGRLEITVGDFRQSVVAIVRSFDDGRIAMALMDDTGVAVIAEMVVTQDEITVRRMIDELEPYLPLLAQMLRSGYMPPEGDITWRDENSYAVLSQQNGEVRYWYGGDPFLLRWVTSESWWFNVGDYRIFEGERLVPYGVAGWGPVGAEVILRLQTITPR